MKLFVAKLNRDVQDEHLEEAFSKFGPVGYARVITDRDTGQSKCFGFVQMREAEDGRNALEEMNFYSEPYSVKVIGTYSRKRGN